MHLRLVPAYHFSFSFTGHPDPLPTFPTVARGLRSFPARKYCPSRRLVTGGELPPVIGNAVRARCDSRSRAVNLSSRVLYVGNEIAVRAGCYPLFELGIARDILFSLSVPYLFPFSCSESILATYTL